MTKKELIDLCLELPDTYEDYPFDRLTETPGAWTVMRHKNNKKGFAHIYSEYGRPIINLKLNPFEGDMLRKSFNSVKPAYHMNKEHWNGVAPDGDVPVQMLKVLIAKSYGLTKPKEK